MLLHKALSHPLTTVVAGPGYGKSTAVYSYLRVNGIRTVWVQLTDHDNMVSHFWEALSRAVAPLNQELATAMLALGFPESKEMLAYFAKTLQNDFKPRYRYAIVFDDLHLLQGGSVLDFIARLAEVLSTSVSVVTLSRLHNLPDIDGLSHKGLLAHIDENDLAFTRSEMQEYFGLMGVVSSTDVVTDIYQDSRGMPFAVSLAAQLLARYPEDSVYIRSALKGNINRLIDEQIFSGVSEELMRFLVRLSLVKHLAPELIAELEGGQEAMDQLLRVSSLIRYDQYMHVYHIHHLLLQYLEGKQDLLSEEDRMTVYRKAARWCVENGYRIDAISYYRAMGDYDAIILVAYAYPLVLPYDVASELLEIFEQAPMEFFDTNPGARVLHPRLIMTLGRAKEAVALAYEYLELLEARPLTADNSRTLMGLHNTLGFAKMTTCPETHDYSFPQHFKDALGYFEKASRAPIRGHMLYNVGSYALLVGRGERGEPEACIEAVRQSTECTAISFRGCMFGLDSLMSSEYAYFRGLSSEAECHALRAISDAKMYDQFEIVGRALFMLIRSYLQTGKYEQLIDVFSQLDDLMQQTAFMNRHLLHDVVSSWFYATIGELNRVESWLKSDLWSSGLNRLVSGVEDDTKVRYYLATKDFKTLLAFTESQGARFGITRFFIGRIGLSVTKAICHLRLGAKEKAFAHLKEAYDLAKPCGIEMSFIEGGNHMRSLMSAALKEPDLGIPTSWLETIRSKATTYAKRVAYIRSRYLEVHGPATSIQLTTREIEILRDLSQGLSRTEISLVHDISINTVKTMLQMIYDKLGAESGMDAIRIATANHLL
jgi:LuxR family maltose regulon positive regulatory protein